MEIKLQEVIDLAKSNKHRIEKLEDNAEKQVELILAVAAMAEKQNNMDESLSEIKTDIKSIKEKPGKRWDSIVEKVLLAIVAGLIGYLFIKLGLA